jgi:hypothetical protein
VAVSQNMYEVGVIRYECATVGPLRGIYQPGELAGDVASLASWMTFSVALLFKRYTAFSQYTQDFI